MKLIKEQKEAGSKTRFVLIFGDEWPTVEKMLADEAENGELAKEYISQTLEKLKAKSGHSRLFNPQFLDDWEGEYYFADKTTFESLAKDFVNMISEMSGDEGSMGGSGLETPK